MKHERPRLIEIARESLFLRVISEFITSQRLALFEEIFYSNVEKFCPFGTSKINLTNRAQGGR